MAIIGETLNLGHIAGTIYDKVSTDMSTSTLTGSRILMVSSTFYYVHASSCYVTKTICYIVPLPMLYNWVSVSQPKIAYSYYCDATSCQIKALRFLTIAAISTNVLPGILLSIVTLHIRSSLHDNS